MSVLLLPSFIVVVVNAVFEDGGEGGLITPRGPARTISSSCSMKVSTNAAVRCLSASDGEKDIFFGGGVTEDGCVIAEEDDDDAGTIFDDWKDDDDDNI